jgi:hypothetical protein
MKVQQQLLQILCYVDTVIYVFNRFMAFYWTQAKETRKSWSINFSDCFCTTRFLYFSFPLLLIICAMKQYDELGSR